MKNLLKTGLTLCLAILVINLTGCGKAAAEASSGTTDILSPPAWIQGTWIQSSLGMTSGYQFTSEDVYMVIEDVVTLGTEEAALLQETDDLKEITVTETVYAYQQAYTSNGTPGLMTLTFTKAGSAISPKSVYSLSNYTTTAVIYTKQ
ncbi:MAG: hypothetical protein ACI9BD_000077 [Candidatus Marinamargulisbacteria bacterium]|jgi:hypothetical protein